MIVISKTKYEASEAEIKKLFPNTYGMPVVTFEPSNAKVTLPAFNVEIISGGGDCSVDDTSETES